MPRSAPSSATRHEAVSCATRSSRAQRELSRHLIELHEARECAACGVVFENREQEEQHTAKCCGAHHEKQKEKKADPAGGDLS